MSWHRHHWGWWGSHRHWRNRWWDDDFDDIGFDDAWYPRGWWADYDDGWWY